VLLTLAVNQANIFRDQSLILAPTKFAPTMMRTPQANRTGKTCGRVDRRCHRIAVELPRRHRRYLVSGADPIALAIPRRGIGFVCLLPAALQLTLRKTLGVGESITLNLVVGLIAFFAGIWIATSGSRKPSAAAPRPVAGLSSCRLFSG
jgi:hypothetical protein